MVTSRFRSAVLLATGAFLLSSSVYAVGVLPASAGFADNSNFTNCFQRDFSNPGRVSYNAANCNNGTAAAWWDMPMPITSTGSKTFSVYVNNVTSVAILECDAMVLGNNGTISRWSVKKNGVFAGWVQFASLAVNSDETAEISCEILDATNWPGGYVSAVKGF